MGKQVQLLRGTTAENNIFTGEEGALTYNTETKAIVVHDGKTQGGGGFIDTVVEFQLPTEENNYTWYRKYASGWVEQGGQLPASATTITLPVTMANAEYFCLVSYSKTESTTTDFALNKLSSATQSTAAFTVTSSTLLRIWEVKGLAADA